ncbi:MULTISPECIES: hypothetical protein [Halomonadaceae]|uniref:PH domain-containing protein n=1 Tax=Vreelandella piezotolerans TaxID=2609667 RepID=A0ABQ6X8Y9_9GAMM|nr:MULTISPECIES: hypothetical protein [Halomonas]KAE8438467.1 hypothetical protein F1978_08990 [Halomonas piezotolerans]MCG7592166.1 hypothetical protein [Halomonas sp. McD50-5]MCG7618217.1 hypothetical protein [Halomonas sp. McD50-4]QJA22848.1 hypothetical protein GYM47_01300 [Halomonas piezotolerans]BCB60738.1 hypothetical protein HaloA020_14390 [Halomonas sp. A020]
MAVYGGIQAHEVERWLNALTNAAYDRRCPLSKVHGGNARARTARQDLLHLATVFRGGECPREAVADGLSRWCQHYLTEAEWYVLVGGRRPPVPPNETASIDEQAADEALAVLYQHRVG